MTEKMCTWARQILRTLSSLGLRGRIIYYVKQIYKIDISLNISPNYFTFLWSKFFHYFYKYLQVYFQLPRINVTTVSSLINYILLTLWKSPRGVIAKGVDSSLEVKRAGNPVAMLHSLSD